MTTDLAKHRVRQAALTLFDTLGKPTRIEQHHAFADHLRFIEAHFPGIKRGT